MGTCIVFSSGKWVPSHNLTEKRVYHNSWVTDEGIMLLGGAGGDSSSYSSEIVKPGEYDGVPGFTLPYRTDRACSFPDKTTDTLIITGGQFLGSRVTRYSTSGFVEDLPRFNKGRLYHGCGSYLKEDGMQVFMVAGGSTYAC